jgi:cyclic pyranopterin phosphate synthase
MGTGDTSSLESPAAAWPTGPGPAARLRISITDRCNFRCVYCMPKDVFDKNHVYLPHTVAVVRGNHARGAPVRRARREKIRLTGGERAAAQEYRKADRHAGRLRTPSGQPLDLT